MNIFKDNSGMKYLVLARVVKTNKVDTKTFKALTTRQQEVTVSIVKEDDVAYPEFLVKYN